MTIDPKKTIAIREEIRNEIRKGLKSSMICEMGYDSEIVLEVKAEENNLRDKQSRQEEIDFQKRQQESKRERQYRQTMIDLGQDPDNVTQNDGVGSQTTVSAPVTEVNTGSENAPGTNGVPAIQ